jgi:hypothetical protein
MNVTPFIFYTTMIFMVLAPGSIIFGLIQSVHGNSSSIFASRKTIKARILFQRIAIVLFGVLIYINRG